MSLVAILFYANLTGSDEHLEHAFPHRYAACDPQFRRTSSNLLGPQAVNGNRVTTLLNGDQAFPAMLDAIRSAKHSITFEGYIFWSGAIAQQFADAFSERARNGVPTHLVLDWLGSKKMDQKHLEQMRQAGVEIVRIGRSAGMISTGEQAHPPEDPGGGRQGRVRGRDGNRRPSGPAMPRTRITGATPSFRVRGPGGGSAAGRFLDNWIKTEGCSWTGRTTSPAGPGGPHGADIPTARRARGRESPAHVPARDRVGERENHDWKPYFVPNSSDGEYAGGCPAPWGRRRVIVPGPILDAQVVRRASRAKWGPLLEAGVKSTSTSRHSITPR